MNKRFSLIELMVLIVIIAMMFPMFAKAESFLYSTQVSTLSLIEQEAANVAGINYSSVKVKNIVIHQTGTVAQTVTIYKNFISTAAAVSLATFAVPGTVGTYYPLGQFAPNTSGGNQDIVNMPYFAVRTSTDFVTAACYMTVLYSR